MNITYKEQLSRHIENIFMGYSKPGLHICDIATGGGKSYTIGKLTCQYYPKKFDRIVILCVQNKLVNSMNHEIDHFINSEGSLISSSDKMVIENNPEVITQAIKNGYFKKLLEEMLLTKVVRTTISLVKLTTERQNFAGPFVDSSTPIKDNSKKRNS